MFSPESEIFLWIKPKKKKNLFCGKFGSMPTFRSTRKGKKWYFFVMSPRLSDHKVVHNIRIASSSSFFQFRSNFIAFFAHISDFLVLKEYNKTIIPFALVGYDTGYSYLPLVIAIYHLISKARSWNNCWLLSNNPLDFVSGIIRQHSPRLRRIIVKRKHKNNSNSNNHLINLSLNGFSRAWWLY